jgi:hypothetical protein
VTGGKLSGASTDAGRPIWYYPAVLYEQHFYLLPLILFGLPALLRRAQTHAISALGLAFGAWLGVVVLSVPAVKEPLYVLAVAPPWYVLAGVCLAELESESATHQVANRVIVQTVLWTMAFAVLASVLWKLSDPTAMSLFALALHAAGMLGCAALGFAWSMRRPLVVPLLCACGVALGVFIFDAERDRAADPYRAVSNALRPLLANAAPAYPSFVASHSKLLMGYLDRAGNDWPLQAPGAALSETAARAFVVGPAEQGRTDFEGVLSELKERCVERPVLAAGHRLFEPAAFSARRAGP